MPVNRAILRPLQDFRARHERLGHRTTAGRPAPRIIATILAGALVALASPLANPTTAQAATTAGEGTYESDSAAIVATGSWSTQSSIYDSDGSVSFATRAASVSLTFTGTSIAWLSRKTSSSGINDVYIDGTKVASVDRYSTGTHFAQTVFKTTSLSNSTHTIKVAWTGRKNAASSSENIILDAFIVGNPQATLDASGPTVPVGNYENTGTAIQYSGAWSRQASTSDSEGSSEYLNSTGAAWLHFEGPAIKWLSRKSSNAGIASVYIDGIKEANVDRYSATTTYEEVVFEKKGLSNSTHTIKIVWSGLSNPASSGKNVLIDAIIVPDITAPAAPTGAAASASGGNVKLAWNQSPAADLDGYRIYGSVNAGRATLIGTADENYFTSLGVPSNSSISYSVSAVDTSGNESVRATMGTLNSGNTPEGTYRYANCPAASVTVTNPVELKAAVAAATPGTVIRMAPGTYLGQMQVSVQGTASQPIWICGSRSVIVDGDGYSKNSAFDIVGSSNLIVTGMTTRHALKGVTVRASNHVMVSDLLVEDIGYEGIHLRSNTTDSLVVGNTIRLTGQRDTFYGEGVYIGSSKANWCALTDCLPDRSDRNAILGNTISETGSDLIESKEGTVDGVIRGNILSGVNGMASTESWIMIAGNDWVVSLNQGTQSSLHGFRLNGATSGWGLRTVFSDNTGSVNASGYGFKVYEVDGEGSTDTFLSCNNTISGAAAGFSNIRCTP